MTENLAGRGEGLAGADEVTCQCGCDEYPECTHMLYWCQGFREGEKLGLKLAALATPSPQAPQEQCNDLSTTSAREQSSATAAGNLSASDANEQWLELARILRFEKGDDGDWFIPAEPQPLGPFFSILQAAIAFMRHIDATDKTMREEIEQLRAATQEQPAGSGAKPILPGVVWTPDGWDAAGSPRKVGEDGNKVNNLSEKWRQSCSVGPLFKDGTLEPVDVREGVLRCADELEVSLKSLGRACAKKARQLGFDVGDGDWWDTDEIVVGLLRAGRERALAGVAEQVRILKSMAEQCNERGMAETPQKEWTPYQGKISAYDCVLGLLERAARSSSVPVGEQKQEEGA